MVTVGVSVVEEGNQAAGGIPHLHFPHLEKRSEKRARGRRCGVYSCSGGAKRDRSFAVSSSKFVSWSTVDVIFGNRWLERSEA